MLSSPRRLLTVLHIFHGLIVLYLLACLFVVYRAAWLASFDTLTLVAIVSLCVEGFVVFMLNDGDCPLAHIQRRLQDETSFFSLFMPLKYARQVIPVVGLLTVAGLLWLLLRLGYAQADAEGVLLPLLQWSWWQLFLFALLLDWVMPALMYGFNRPEQQRPRWRTGVYGDVALPVAIASGLTVAQHDTSALPSWYFSGWLQWCLLLAGLATTFLVEYVYLHRIRRKYTVAQELAPSNLWHSGIFPVMTYLAILALIPLLYIRQPSWEVALAVAGFAGWLLTLVWDFVWFPEFKPTTRKD